MCFRKSWLNRCGSEVDVSYRFRHDLGMATKEDWARLGAAIVRTRTELGMKTRQDLAVQVDLSYRALSDMENGVRGFSPGSYAIVEQALDWPTGTALAILEGGNPPPVSTNEHPVPRLQSPTGGGIRDGWNRGTKRLAHQTPLRLPTTPYPDTLARRRREAEKALERTLGRMTKPTMETLRMMRELLEEQELETLVDRIEKLSRPLQLEISSYVDDMLINDWAPIADIEETPTADVFGEGFQNDDAPSADGDDLETTPQPHASQEAEQDQREALVDDPQLTEAELDARLDRSTSREAIGLDDHDDGAQKHGRP